MFDSQTALDMKGIKGYIPPVWNDPGPRELIMSRHKVERVLFHGVYINLLMVTGRYAEEGRKSFKLLFSLYRQNIHC